MLFLKKTRKDLRVQYIKWFELIVFINLCLDVCAQQCNSFERLTANALNQFLDSLNSYQYRSIFVIDSNYYVFLTDYEGSYCVFDEVNPPVYAVLHQGKSRLLLGCYRFNENKNGFGWHITKRVRPKEESNVCVILKPQYDFLSDTLEITFRTASYFKSYLRGTKKKAKSWVLGISDWGSFKYLFSFEEKKWINVGAEIGGI